MKNQKGESLVGILVVLAIIMIAVVLFMTHGGKASVLKKSTRKDGLGVTTLGSARAKTLDINCTSNLSQIRMAIQIARDSTPDDTPPPNLDGLRLGSEQLRCPIGQEPYKYDPQTGVVHCEHPGHEEF